MIFYDAQDYRVYLKHLVEVLKGQAVIGGYCLMPNHVHLLVNRRQKRLGEMFRSVHCRYGIYFNQKYDRTGYVFQNRFKSLLVLKQEYLDTLVGYIHNNPVRAGICPSADAYAWSTDAAYRSGELMLPGLFHVAPGYEGAEGTRRYLRRMAMDDFPEPPYFQRYVGTPADLAGVERRSRAVPVANERRKGKTLEQRVAELVRESGATLAELQGKTRQAEIAQARQRIMAKLYREKYSPGAIARIFNRTSAAVTLAASRHGQ